MLTFIKNFCKISVYLTLNYNIYNNIFFEFVTTLFRLFFYQFLKLNNHKELRQKVMFTKRYINVILKRGVKMKTNPIFWLNAARFYSIPMSIMSWSVPFLFAALDGGNVFYGIISLIGIVFAHLGVNLFDDFIDYIIEQRKIKKGLKEKFSLQKGKCAYLLNKEASLGELFLIISVFFAIAIFCGIFLTLKTGIFVLYLMIIAGLIGALYPLLSYVAMGEIAVGIMFAPLLYTGVYFVMTESFSTELIPIAISTGLLTIGLLHAHMFLDIDFDKKSNKITLCSLAKSKKRAVRNQVIITVLAYLNIFVMIFFGLPKIYILSFLSIPTAIILYKLMICDCYKKRKEIKTNIFFGYLGDLTKYENTDIKEFIIKFSVARNIMVEFTVLICIAKIISEIL